MAEQMRKRLLYDFSPIPEAPVNENEKGPFDPVVRVVFEKNILMNEEVLHKPFTVGTDEAADLSLDEKLFNDNMFELVSLRGNKPVLHLRDGMKGYVYDGTQKKDISLLLAEGKREIELTEKMFAVADFGEMSVVVMMTTRERMVKSGIRDNLDIAALLIIVVVFILGWVILDLIMETPPIELDIFEMDNRFAQMIVQAPEEDIKVEEVEKEKKVKLEKPKEGIVEATQARKSLGDEGRVGDKKSRVANAQGSARRGLDDKVAASSGIMGALSSGAQSFDRIFGGGGLGAGMEKTLGSVTGISGMDQFGSGGLGTRGFGTGGGGNALGIGGLGTRGRGGGGGGYGAAGSYGMGQGRLGAKGRANIAAGGGQAVIMGALDRAIIDQYIRRNIAKIRWCYEKELNKDPKLFGKIVVKFIIGADGKVTKSDVGRTTMGNSTVEECVAAQIKKIRFPSPKGGGIVVVTYPFVFKNTEGQLRE